LCTVDHHIGYELVTNNALGCLTEYEELCESSIFKKTLADTEDTLRSHIESIDTLHVRLHTKRICRFLFLRHHQLYLRYFYPGIISKHPNNEYYANYKHTLKKKKIVGGKTSHNYANNNDDRCLRFCMRAANVWRAMCAVRRTLSFSKR
jgi:hypothetical protein